MVLGSLTALGPLTVDLCLPTLPEVRADLYVSQAVIQLTLTAFVIGIALGQLVIGPLSDTPGRRRPLLTGLSVYVVASALCALAQDPAVLIGMRLVHGLAGAADIVVARADRRARRSAVDHGRALLHRLSGRHDPAHHHGPVPATRAARGGQCLRASGHHQFLMGALAPALAGLGGQSTALPMAM
ncbi:MFS transporter [Streptomyces asoensis]|uniref:MFS transporter n=1 Tax=Streptomyces asoensis TaxID=249586 RepID=UPI0036CEA74E